MKKLSKDDQKVVIDALKLLLIGQQKRLFHLKKILLLGSRKGITVNVVDRTPFINAVKPALTGDATFTKEMYEKLQAIQGN